MTGTSQPYGQISQRKAWRALGSVLLLLVLATSIPAAAQFERPRSQTANVASFRMFGIQLGMALPEAKDALVNAGFFCIDLGRDSSARYRQDAGAEAQQAITGSTCRAMDRSTIEIRGTAGRDSRYFVSYIRRSIERTDGDRASFYNNIEETFGAPTLPEYPHPARWCARLESSGRACDRDYPWMERQGLSVTLDIGNRFDNAR